MKSTATTWAIVGVLNGMVAGMHLAKMGYGGGWTSAAIVSLSLVSAVFAVLIVKKAQGAEQ